MKIQAAQLHAQFLDKLAQDYTNLYHTTAVNAIKAIKQSKPLRRDYLQICQIIGYKKDKNPLTQITTLDRVTKVLVLLMDRDKLEDDILRRNQSHA